MADPFGIDPEFLGKVPLFAELQRLLRWDKGPVNWDLAAQLATATAAAKEGAGAHAVDETAAEEAARHAALLVDEVTDLGSAHVRVLGPVAFAGDIARQGRELFEAVAVRTTSGFTEGVGLPDELPEGADDALRAMGPLLHGAQLGGVIGAAASNAIGWCDLGLPIERDAPVIVPVVVGRIAREHGLDERAALLTSMLRALVDHGVVAASSTLRSRFLSAFLELVATLEHDVSQLGEQLRDIDPGDPESLQRLVGGGLNFERSAGSVTASELVDTTTALYVAAVDRLVRACAAKAGVEPATVRACASRRDSDAVNALRGMLGLSPVDSASADAFVDAIVIEGGFELLQVALDDPMHAPKASDLRDPPSWIQRARL